MTLCLPAPGQSAFVPPDCNPFREPSLSWWTLDLTRDVQLQQRELAREMDWDLEDRWMAHLERQSKKRCRTPDVMYAPGLALPSQMELWGSVA